MSDERPVMQANPHLEQESTLYGVPLQEAELAVYAVHGRGQSPSFMQQLADRIALPGIGYFMPAAKDSSWYPYGFLEPLEKNQPELDFALDAVGAQLDMLADLGIGKDSTVLLGFSQGACLLSEFLLRSQARYAGAVLHTGGYLGPDEQAWPAGTALAGMPVVMASAAEDVWVPLPRIEATAAALGQAGAAVELHVYDETEHHINDNSVARIRKLLRRLISSKES